MKVKTITRGKKKINFYARRDERAIRAAVSRFSMTKAQLAKETRETRERMDKVVKQALVTAITMMVEDGTLVDVITQAAKDYERIKRKHAAKVEKMRRR